MSNSKTMYLELKNEVQDILIELARAKSLITYSELTERIKTEKINVRSPLLYKILDEISIEQDNLGQGLLAAIVVGKKDLLPGQGFYELAKVSKRDISDPITCWAKEINTIYNHWKV